MNDRLKIETILGYVANDNPLRASRDGISFEGMIPAPAWSEVLVKRSGSVTDTVNEMHNIIDHYYWQGAKVAQVLKGKTLYDTCKNIWDFLFYHIKYKEDSPGKEELRTLARTFAERQSGVDCDDFTIAAGSLMKCLNIPFYIRIARYPGKDYFQHVYAVVPLKGSDYITVDGVLDEYDAEKPPAEIKDFLVMSSKNLSGIPISVLGDVDDDILREVSGVLRGDDFRQVNELEGLGTVASEEQELGAIRSYLQRTRNLIAKRPDLVSESEHPETFLGMVDYALKYWDTDKRDEALGVLEGEESRLNELEGLGTYPEGYESVNLFYGVSDEGSYNVLGKAKKERKFFTKVKQAVKKAGTGIKKLTKAVVRYNPVVAGIRSAVLLALKVNLLKVGSKLKWGYLTREEAQKHGFDLNEWAKVKSQLAKAENLFVKDLQGKAENFKRAILTGRAGGLSGIDGELGVVAAAASTAAAVPFITKILQLLKNVDYNKLIGAVKKAKLKLSKKKADKDQPTNDGDSAMPEGGQTSDSPPDTSDNSSSGDNSAPSDNTSTDTGDNSSNADNSSDGSAQGDGATEGNDDASTQTDGKKVLITSNPPQTSDGSSESPASDGADANGAKLPAPTDMPVDDGSGGSGSRDANDPSIITKVMDWVKDNKGASALIGAGAVFLMYEIFKPKKEQKTHTALSGVKKGKKRKGKAKKNPPHAISGTPKRSKRKKTRASKRFKL